MPLRDASAHYRGRPPCSKIDAGARAMSGPAEKFVLEPERFEFTASPLHQFELARRDFFKILGAGIAVFAIAKDAFAAQETAPGHRSFHTEDLPKDISAWLHVGEDGSVTGFTGKAEIGQNIRTALAQTIADELRVPFESVRMVTADTALTPFDAGTFGSRTTPTITPQLRRVAAAARDLLVEAAAREWNINSAGLVAANAKVTDPASGRSLKYAELARGKTLAQNLPAEDPITPPTEWTIAGKAIPKVDGRAFVTGKHQYTTDLRPPGMLYGKVLRPPSFGATLTSFQQDEKNATPGVFVVRDGNFVGAAAPTEREAQAALGAVKAEWKEVPQISNKELIAYLKQNGSAKTEDRFRKQKGSIQEGLPTAAHRLDATYTVAYIAHAPLEPRAAVAPWADGKITVWTGTQRPFANRDELAAIFHLPESSVRVIVPDTASAYGGKHTLDHAIAAARLARAAARPPTMVWTREQNFPRAHFSPPGAPQTHTPIASAVTPTAWEIHNYPSR